MGQEAYLLTVFNPLYFVSPTVVYFSKSAKCLKSQDETLNMLLGKLENGGSS